MITLPSLIPTFILEKSDKIEDIKNETCYIVASNGFFLKQKQDLFESISKVDSISIFAEVKEFTNVDIPRIPMGLIQTVVKFFEKIYEQYKSEVAVILHFNPTTKKWHIEVPEQTVSGASVDYDRKTNRRIDGFIRIGTIHSHSSMGAFHSGVDDADEENFDGIHITIGNLDKEEKSFSARMMCNKKAYKLEPLNYINDDEFKIPELPKEWFDKVSERYTYKGGGYGGGYEGGSYYDDQFYGHYMHGGCSALTDDEFFKLEKMTSEERTNFWRQKYKKQDEEDIKHATRKGSVRRVTRKMIEKGADIY